MRVLAAERIVFAELPAAAVVAIALVAGHDDDGAGGRAAARRLEHDHGALDVRGEGLDGIAIGTPHEGLGGQVEDDLRLAPLERLPDGARGPDVAVAPRRARARQPCGEAARRRGKRETGHLGPGRLQKQREPASLEAGVPGHEGPPALETGEEAAQAQTFQGAWRDSQRASSVLLSRSVSIGLQKPWCRYARSWPSWARRARGSPSRVV